MTDISLATNVPFAVTAGVATFFSPCAYPLLPGYVGFYVNSVDADSASVLGAGARGLAAAVGVLATFALLAGATVRIGYSTLANITVFETLVGGLLIVFGLLVVFGRTPSISVPLPKRRTGVFGFGLFGAGYALAGAGCVAPVFLGVVARAIALPSETAVIPIGRLCRYCRGPHGRDDRRDGRGAHQQRQPGDGPRRYAEAARGRSDDRRGRRTAVPLARRLLIARGR